MLSSYNKWYVGLVLLLLASPALSLLGIFGFSYFPNEKIAILLVAISKYAWKRSFFQLRLLSLIVASVFKILIRPDCSTIKRRSSPAFCISTGFMNPLLKSWVSTFCA